MSACFKLVFRDERRKSEVNFEADYVSDSFMDENTEFNVLRNGTVAGDFQHNLDQATLSGILSDLSDTSNGIEY